MEALNTISNAITLAKQLREISKNIEEAEFKNVLADLMIQLANVKIESADAKERIADLMAKNGEPEEDLERVATAETDPPTGIKWGCYVWDGVLGQTETETSCYSRGWRSDVSCMQGRTWPDD